MSTEERLEKLLWEINRRLDEIHAEALANLRSFTRSVGQKTRVRKS